MKMDNTNIKSLIFTTTVTVFRKSYTPFLFILVLIVIYFTLNPTPWNSNKTSKKLGKSSDIPRKSHIDFHRLVDIESIDSGFTRRLPHCIIAGVRKAGTAALRDYLDIHPDIVISGGEKHFFDSSKNYKKGKLCGITVFRFECNSATSYDNNDR